MKKILNLALLIGICSVSANIALADGMVFDPVDFPAPPAATDSIPKSEPIVNTTTNVTKEVVSKGNDNFQNALFQLDSAQVEIRNSLLDYKSKYSDVDNQYKLIKNERKLLGKQVKEIEKKIKDIDKTKEQIRKNIN